jgi:hypothetical protein
MNKKMKGVILTNLSIFVFNFYILQKRNCTKLTTKISKLCSYSKKKPFKNIYLFFFRKPKTQMNDKFFLKFLTFL